MPLRDCVSSPRWLLALAAPVVVAAVWLIGGWWATPPSPESLLQSARKAAARGDLATAQRAAQQAADQNPAATEAWLLLAQWRLQSRQYAEAVSAWEHVPAKSSAAAEARLRAAETCLRQLRQLSRAERNFRAASDLAPDDPAALNGLAQTLAMAGRRSELANCLVRLIQLDAYSNFHLDLLVRGPELNVDPQLLPPAERTPADDLAARCAHARIALYSGAAERARDELTAALQTDETYVPAQLLYGRVLLTLGADAELQAWLRGAAAPVRQDADYWLVALAAAQRWGDDGGAARCAWEALSRDPNDVAACVTLGRALRQSGEAELSSALLERAERLERYAAAVSSARRAQNWDAMKQAAALAESLGLDWEAWGWTRLAARLRPGLSWTRASLERLTPRVAELQRTRTDPAQNPARRVDPARFPQPQLSAARRAPPQLTERPPTSPLRFREDAPATGLEFRYHNGGDCLRSGLQKMYEFTGGGVGALDFDRDGAPDLYFPQGGEFAQRGRPMSLTDQLWRNLPDAGWRDVTAAAGFTDEGFGQGVCAGDVDNDGFPDLLVLNIGANVLWRNNGDGTFQRSLEFAQFAGDAWSVAAAIVDLDGDAHPDIYVVNYLTGDDVFERVCRDGQSGRNVTCHPLVFPAAPDQLLRNLGDGRFAEDSTASGVDQPEGRGMGLVVGRLTQPAALDIYVANDSTANFHFVRQPAARGTEPPLRFAEEAIVRGTALNAAGRAQASMGIAVGDADADGRPDLFLTNFEHESSTLYLQQGDGLFTDRTQEFELLGPSRSMLGFGTQFLDADLDGHPELLVANGHVHDKRGSGSQYQMRPQLFRNLAGRAFQEVAPADAGPYFEGAYLGRGIAVLDWNCDGRPDAAVAHLDRPAALLTNVSPPRGRWLQIHCVGTIAARDPIGATISVRGAAPPIVRQLTAGDGYAASNQRTLFVGLGSFAADVVTLDVAWPSGATAELRDVPVDREIVIIEGRSQALPLARKRPATDSFP